MCHNFLSIRSESYTHDTYTLDIKLDYTHIHAYERNLLSC